MVTWFRSSRPLPEGKEKMLLEQLRKEVCAANCDLQRYWLTLLTWGNVSGIDRSRRLVVIKPSGVPYGELTPETMVVLDLDGKVAEGNLRPSSDAPSHLVLYKAFTRIGGICHVHSPRATMFAQACRPIPCLGTTHADTFHGEIPVTRPLRKPEIENDYEATSVRLSWRNLSATIPWKLRLCW